MWPASRVPRKLAKADVQEGFDSGAPELDEWLVRYSWQNQRANNAVTYVTVLDGRVVGYYAIAVSSVAREMVSTAVASPPPCGPCCSGQRWTPPPSCGCS